MGTTADAPPAYVTRDLCQAIQQEQREANRRTWEELRTLRRWVVLLVIGGHLFSGGLNLAGLHWWFEDQAAQPNTETVRMVAAVRAEIREDLRDLRRDLHDLESGARDRAAPAPDARTAPAESEPSLKRKGDSQ